MLRYRASLLLLSNNSILKPNSLIIDVKSAIHMSFLTKDIFVLSNIWRNISCVNLFTYSRIYMAWLFKNLHMTWCLVSLFSHLLSLEFMLSHYIVIIVLCTELNTVLKGCLSLTHFNSNSPKIKNFYSQTFLSSLPGLIFTCEKFIMGHKM